MSTLSAKKLAPLIYPPQDVRKIKGNEGEKGEQKA